MENHLKIADLIVAFLEGKISPEQAVQLDRWLESSERHKKLFLDLLSAGNFNKERSKLSMEKTEQAYQKVVTARRPRPRVWRYFGYAAASIAVFLLGIQLFYHEAIVPPGFTETVSKQDRNKAYLTLASGEQILLSHRDTVLETQENQISISGKGEIVYKAPVLPQDTHVIYHEITTPKGSEFFLQLPDQTKVWLNSNTRLRFPLCFNGKERKIELHGEAYFEVSPDSLHPFIVSTGQTEVKVLGTEFCIRNYAGKNNRTTLIEGSVEIADRSGNKRLLRPGEQAWLENNRLEVKEVETLYYTSWKDGFFIFNQEKLENILIELADWYDFNFTISDTRIAAMRMTARIKKYDRIDRIVELLSKTGKFTFHYENKSIIITNF